MSSRHTGRSRTFPKEVYEWTVRPAQRKRDAHWNCETGGRGVDAACAVLLIRSILFLLSLNLARDNARSPRSICRGVSSLV